MSPPPSAARCKRVQAGPRHLWRHRQRPRSLLERLAVPAGAGGASTSASRSRCGSSSSRRTTRPWSPSSRACAPTPAVRRQPRRTSLGYLSPITAGELDARAASSDDTSLNAASHRRPGRRRAGVRPLPARHGPATSGSRSTRWAGCSATTARCPAGPATPWSPPSTPRCRPPSSTRWHERDPHRPGDLRPGDPPQLRAPTPAPRSCCRPRPAGSSRWPASRRTTRRSGSAASPASSSRALYSAKAGDPLLARATQGQFAPGSTWKPFMTVGALNNGFSPSTATRLLLGLPGRQPAVQELRVRVLRRSSTSPRRCSSPATPSSTGWATTSGSSTAPTRPTSNAKDPLVARRRSSASAGRPAIDVPGEAAGRIADRHWKLAYWKSMKGYYCGDRPHAHRRGQRVPARCSPTSSASRALLPRRRRGELRDRAGRHPRHPAAAGPRVRRALQRRHALRAADRQGDRQPRRQGDQADQAQGAAATSRSQRTRSRYVDNALLGTAKVGTMAWKIGGFPLDKVHLRVQDRVGRGLRQAVAPRGSPPTTRTTSC